MRRPSSQKNRLISRSQTLRSVFIFSTRSSHTPPLQDGAKVQQSHGKVCLLSSQTSRGVSREREARKRPPKRLLLGIATKSIGISEERDPCQSEGAVIWEERDLTVQIVISVTLCSWLLTADDMLALHQAFDERPSPDNVFALSHVSRVERIEIFLLRLLSATHGIGGDQGEL